MGVGSFGAVLGVLFLGLVTVPSFVTWVLKFRSGVAPSLKGADEAFAELRLLPDQSTVLFGTALWGCAYTALLGFVVFFLVAFAFAWPVSTGTALLERNEFGKCCLTVYDVDPSS